MIHKNRVHLHLAEGKRHFTQPTDIDFPGELAHRYREERRSHRLGHDFFEAGASPVEPYKANHVFSIVSRRKKREPLDVVPMRMRDQEGVLYWLRPKLVVHSNKQLANLCDG